MNANGTAIQAIRERSGLTKSQLAAATGIDRTHLHRMETGERNGTPAQILAIAKALAVPTTAILNNVAAESAAS